jgi:hypothetical protein
VLKRAIWTLWHCLDEMDRTWLPVVNDWRLNERHYGALQGLNKADMARQYGDEQVLIWRRSYDTPPPALAAGRPARRARRPALCRTAARQVPLTECLKDTVARVLPCWDEALAPAIRRPPLRGRRARQLDPRAGQVPRRHQRRRHRRAEHPQRHPAGLRARRAAAAAAQRYLGDAEAVAGPPPQWPARARPDAAR